MLASGLSPSFMVDREEEALDLGNPLNSRGSGAEMGARESTNMS
jgi:hypothetical protein